MKRIWNYPLHTDENSRDMHYEGTILPHNGHVCYASTRPNAMDFHIINIQTGENRMQTFPLSPLRALHEFVSPPAFFAFPRGNRVIYYAGELIEAEGLQILRTLKLPAEVTSHLLLDDRLLVVCDKLCCINLETFTIAWELELANEQPYAPGPVTRFGSLVTCYGQDQLLFVDPANGKVTDAIRIPRISKLYHPIALDDDTLLIGCTNWTNAGILMYRRSTKKVVWRYKRSFEGPQTLCRIWHEKDRVYWVKNRTELICLDTRTGAEVFHLRTAPWLYTDLLFRNGCILYGTAGANGFLNRLDACTGQMKWSVFLQNGCAYYDIHDGAAFAGDFSKTIFRIDLGSGAITDQLQLDGEVVGRIAVHAGSLYTVIWGSPSKPVRLVRIGLDA